MSTETSTVRPSLTEKLILVLREAYPKRIVKNMGRNIVKNMGRNKGTKRSGIKNRVMVSLFDMPGGKPVSIVALRNDFVARSFISNADVLFEDHNNILPLDEEYTFAISYGSCNVPSYANYCSYFRGRVTDVPIMVDQWVNDLVDNITKEYESILESTKIDRSEKIIDHRTN